MLSRGIYDALAIWPVVAWPIIFSSCFWAFLRLCKVSQGRYGFSALNSPRASNVLLAWLYLPAGALFELAVHLYLLWVIGAIYALVALPIAVIGWLALPVLLDEIGPAMLLLPALHVTFAAAFVVLLGFADIGVLREMNAEIYTLLRGVRVSM